MFRTCLLGCLLISSTILANEMQQSFNDGMATGKANNGAAQNATQGFNPSEIEGYQANPEQSKYYTGIMGDNPNISTLGMQELSSSELGKTLRESTINNPKDNISMDSDIIKNSEEIQKNANVITGNVAGKQCVKQVLSKSTFTNHFCEKDQAIDAMCKEEVKVNWTTKTEYIEKEFVLNGFKLSDANLLVDGKPVKWVCLRTNSHDNCVQWGANSGEYSLNGNISFNSPASGKLVKYKVETVKQEYKNFIESKSRTQMLGVNGSTNKENNVGVAIEQGNNIKIILDLGYGYSGGTMNMIYRNRYRLAQGLEFKVTLTIGVAEIVPTATTEKVYSCSHNIKNAIKLSDECTVAGGNRNFVKDGKTVAVYADCWERTEKYLVSEASDNECKKYDDDPNCTVGERECLDSLDGNCTRFRLKYQCQHTTRTDGVVCGDKFFCSDGSCADLEGSVNTDFGHAVSQLAMLAQAGKDVALNPDSLKAFSGKAMFCRKTGFGFSNCCKDSGWGHKAGLAHCNSEEDGLGKAKEKNLVIYTGTYCDKEVLGKCIRKKSSYCVFDNKLARIIQYQGRSGQLGVGFGSAQNPDCRGLSVEELQRIDFNAMDYSDFYNELNEGTKLPDQNQLIDYMKKTITEQLKQE